MLYNLVEYEDDDVFIISDNLWYSAVVEINYIFVLNPAWDVT